MVKVQRLFAKTNLEIPVYLLIKRLVPFGSSRFCLHHPLSLPLLRKGWVQAAQQAELWFCHAVVFHAVLTVFLKIHVAVQLIDGLIIQPQRLLQSLLTVTIGTLHNALIIVQISQELTGTVQGFRPLRLQHGGVGQKHPVLLPDVLQGFGKIVVILHGGAIRITDQLPDVRHLEVNITEHGIRENINIEVSLHSIEVFLVSGEDEGVVGLSIDTQRHAEHFIPALIPPRLCRRKIAAVDPHIQRQQTAGVGDKGTVPGMPKRRANGEGNIRKRKDGRWEGRYTVGHDPETGKAIIKNVLGKTQAEVKEKLKKAIEENVGIDYGKAKTYTVGSWLEVWMENYAKVKLRPSTFKTSQGFLKNHIKPQIGSIPLADLTSLDLQRFYKHLLDGGRVDRIEAKKKPKGLAPKTVRNIHQMIGSAYNLAIEQRLVTKNPTQGCALPKVEHKEMKTLTADQLSAFFQEARDSGVYELYYLDFATGLRRGELLGLKWTDVDLDRGVLKIQRAISRQNGKVVEAPLKTKNAYRTLPLSADAISVLMQQRRKTGNSEWVFPSPTGGPMSPDSVLQMLQRVLKRAGLPRIRFHDLRHPYVKHTTKIFSLRLMDFQAQAYPDARRKTRGACQLHRGG